jgi:hypothetical protein
MDRQKIRELLKQTHPKHKVVDQGDESRYASDSNADDVDVKNLSPTTWKKFGTAPIEKASGDSSSKRSASSDLRERFRPRTLTGAGPARSGGASGGGQPPGDSAWGSSRSTPGKVTLERLVPNDGTVDTDDSLDVIVDEEHGVIGESDSGPEDD